MGWVLAGALLLSGLTVALIYNYQEKIIQLFIAEANKHLKTKVQVGHIALSWWDKFPQVSVSLHQVRVTEGLPGSTAPLATAKKIFCTFSLVDLVQKNYQVRELYLEDGQVEVKVLADGSVNYRVFGPDTTTAQEQPLSFDLEKIALKNMVVSYADASLKQFYKVTARDLQAAMALQPGRMTIQSEGGVYVHTLQLKENEYFRDKETYLRTALVIRPEERKLELAPSLIRVGPADYEVSGQVDYAATTVVDLQLAGKNTNVQSILALLPARTSLSLRQYRSTGAVYFNGSIKGPVSALELPQVTFHFGCQGASLFYADYKQQLKDISLTGTFTNGARRSAATSVLSLKNLTGRLDNRPFSANLVLENFRDPGLTLDLKADLDVGHVLGLFPVAEIKNGSGRARVALNFSGKLRQLKGDRGRSQVAAGGDITLHNVTLALRDYAQPFRNLNGTFLVRKNDLAVSDFKGWLGSSDFLLNGYFKNALPWFFLQRQSLLIEADLQSRFLNLDQLLSSSTRPASAAGRPGSGNTGSGGSAYRLVVSPYLDFDLRARVQRLQFRRLQGKDFQGNVQLKNQVISSSNIDFQVIGGHFGLQGYLDARNADNIKVTTTTRLRDLKVDSLFYVFENFGQNFLVQRHLRGELTANIKSDLYFNSYLSPQTDRMEAEVQVLIRNGQLNNFEPLQKLSLFARRSELANMRFAQMSNTFYIQDRTIYIPEMEIHSNVSRASLIGIQGTHTFDQEMDYKIRIPLKRGLKRDRDEDYDPQAPAAQGTPNLFLTLKGNENDFKVAYDKERVKNKIAQDLKSEKQELIQIFKGKKPAEKQKEVQLAPGEFFNF